MAGRCFMGKIIDLTDYFEVTRAINAELALDCDRCMCEPSDPDAKVAEFFQDRYSRLCTGCADWLHYAQAKSEQ
jgi:hypothetical protein